MKQQSRSSLFWRVTVNTTENQKTLAGSGRDVDAPFTRMACGLAIRRGLAEYVRVSCLVAGLR